MMINRQVFSQHYPRPFYSKFKTFFALALTLLAFSGAAAFAQNTEGIKTDFGAYAQGAPPPLPAAGGKLIDPTFGTEIMRATAARDAAGGAAGPCARWARARLRARAH